MTPRHTFTPVVRPKCHDSTSVAAERVHDSTAWMALASGEEPFARSCARHVPECNATRGRENAPGALEGRSIAERTKEVLRWNVQN